MKVLDLKIARIVYELEYNIEDLSISLDVCVITDINRYWGDNEIEFLEWDNCQEDKNGDYLKTGQISFDNESTFIDVWPSDGGSGKKLLLTFEDAKAEHNRISALILDRVKQLAMENTK